jgi:hypothetical protein
MTENNFRLKDELKHLWPITIVYLAVAAIILFVVYI